MLAGSGIELKGKHARAVLGTQLLIASIVETLGIASRGYLVTPAGGVGV